MTKPFSTNAPPKSSPLTVPTRRAGPTASGRRPLPSSRPAPTCAPPRRRRVPSCRPAGAGRRCWYRPVTSPRQRGRLGGYSCRPLLRWALFMGLALSLAARPRRAGAGSWRRPARPPAAVAARRTATMPPPLLSSPRRRSMRNRVLMDAPLLLCLGPGLAVGPVAAHRAPAPGKRRAGPGGHEESARSLESSEAGELATTRAVCAALIRAVGGAPRSVGRARTHSPAILDAEPLDLVVLREAGERRAQRETASELLAGAPPGRAPRRLPAAAARPTVTAPLADVCAMRRRGSRIELRGRAGVAYG